ncbi:hypothetical protein ACFYTQ_31735 [Nocardia sp. NPDC004068]|uniref:hypothetical protein n=1 Tax=Nocardia sp. NPDC004068 TaxID=3364303 RepID=UPI00367BFBEE
MFESCYTPADVAYLLRCRYGLPIEFVAARPAVICGPGIGAVTMPTDLGDRVLGLLDGRSPVVANPRETAWTFLVAPGPPDRTSPRTPRNPAVIVHAPGYRVLMPMSDHGFGWRWACEPIAGPPRLPSCGRVLDLVAEATAGVLVGAGQAGVRPEKSRSTT